LAQPSPPTFEAEDSGPATFQHGWQQQAAQTNHAAQQAELLTHLDPTGQAMLASQTGLFASSTFTTIPWGHGLTSV